MSKVQAAILAREVGYNLLPFRFLRLDDTSPNNLLITAETGEYLFVSDLQLRQLVGKQLERGTSLYKNLLARHFIYEPRRHNPVAELAAQYRSRKEFLFGGPALHLFVVTLRCNHTCQYCQVSRAPLGALAMTCPRSMQATPSIGCSSRPRPS